MKMKNDKNVMVYLIFDHNLFSRPSKHKIIVKIPVISDDSIQARVSHYLDQYVHDRLAVIQEEVIILYIHTNDEIE